MSMDSAFERRQLVRSTWASHPRSRGGASPEYGLNNTSRTVVRFILGQPRKDWERRIRLEQQGMTASFRFFTALTSIFSLQ